MATVDRTEERDLRAENATDVGAAISAVKDMHGAEVVYIEDPTTGTRFPLMVLPRGMIVHNPGSEIDRLLPAPRRLRGQAKAETLDSFCELVKRHKREETAIFAECQNGSPWLNAVIDYHQRGVGRSSPAHCEHRIGYWFPQTDEISAWKGKLWRNKRDFAAFLDERRFNLTDPEDITKILDGKLVSPAPDSMVFEVMWRSVLRDQRDKVVPSNVFASPGEIMRLVESMSSSTSRAVKELRVDRFGGMKVFVESEGKVVSDETIPPLFLVELAPFVGAAKLVLPARIRAQLNQGSLLLCAELEGVERVIERTFTYALKTVAEKTGCPVFRGSPERW